MGSVVDQIKHLTALGHNEIVITGVDITSYGTDLPGKPSLGILVQTILSEVLDLPRLRLSSIDSIEIDEPLMEVIVNEPRLMPHLHLSIQSGDNMILKRMKRRHLREHTIEFCNQVRAQRPDIVFGADLIAGFPTEDEAMFKNTLDIIDQCGLTHIHVFPYSSRKGTPAARMPQTDPVVVKQRAKRLRQAAENRFKEYLASRRGSRQKVLVERYGFGYSEQYIPVYGVDGDIGEIVDVEISDHDQKGLIATSLKITDGTKIRPSTLVAQSKLVGTQA